MKPAVPGVAAAIAVLIAAVASAQEPSPPPAEPPPPPPAWTGNAGLGLSLTRGNADTSTISLTSAAQYDPKGKSLFKADASYLRGSAEGEATVDRTLAGARYERKLGKRWFAFGEGRYLRDRFKDIRYLVTPLAGLGVMLAQGDRTTFGVDAAFGAAIEKDDDLEAKTSGALKLGESLAWKVSSTATFTHAATALYKTNDFEDALYHAEATLAASVTQRSELKVTLSDDYKNKPANPALDKNDVTLLAALVMKF